MVTKMHPFMFNSLKLHFHKKKEMSMVVRAVCVCGHQGNFLSHDELMRAISIGALKKRD